MNSLTLQGRSNDDDECRIMSMPDTKGSCCVGHGLVILAAAMNVS
jgi:hypothetical protein